MNRELVAGPSGAADWVIRQASGGGSPPRVLTLPDAANPQRIAAGLGGIQYVLPEAPRLAHDSSGRPVLQISLLLGRKPGPQDNSIFDLVQSGALSCDLTLKLPTVALGDSDLPLFARQANFQLLKTGGGETPPAVLTEISGGGADVRVGLAAHLDQANARAVLLALNGVESGLVLSCTVGYRIAESRGVVHLNVQWARVYDFLSLKLDGIGSFNQTQLQGWLLEMAHTGVITATQVDGSGNEAPITEAEAPRLIAAFLKIGGLLLDRSTPDLDSSDVRNLYQLRDRPDEAAELDLRLSVTTAAEKSKSLQTPLEEVIGGVLENQVAEDFIHLSYADPTGSGGARQAPRLLRSPPRSREAPAAGPLPLTRLAAVDDSAVSMTRALTPRAERRPAAAVLLASDVIRPHGGQTHAFAVDDMAIVAIATDRPHLPNLPIADPLDAAVWPDGNAAGTYWYKPDFRLAAADPAAGPDDSTFQFIFHETGHDNAGQPVLEGEVLFTLLRGISPATTGALQSKGNPAARPVPTEGLSVTLSLPVLDERGQLRQVNLRGDIKEKNDVVEVRVGLLNQYVRVAYGDLAIAGFQAAPARLNIAYSFDSLVPTDDSNAVFPMAGKLQVTPVAFTPLQASALVHRGAYFDATEMGYRSPGADVSFHREPAVTRAADLQVLAPGAATRTVAAAAITPLRPSLNLTAIRPEMLNYAGLHDLIRKRKFAQQTQVGTASLDAFFPCNVMGTFYRQDFGDHKTSIGCQNSFSLGQTTLKLYEELDNTSFASPFYRIYRSLSQPGRFLLLPATYRITRYAPSEAGRAYRPAIYMYSSLDSEQESNNRCIVMAALQPDLPLWVRRDLSAKLARLHHSPTVQYVTEIDSELEYSWQFSGGLTSIQPQAAKLWDSFQVTLSTDLAGGLQLQSILANSGLAAHVNFSLSDGMRLGSGTDLILDLAQLTGPFDGGPLETALQASSVGLTNRIERGINISDVAAYGLDATLQSVRVDRLLNPGETVSVGLPATTVEAFPVYSIQPGTAVSLTEITSFVEDIHTNVVVVNLVNYANHALKRLDVAVRLAGVLESEKSLAISEEQPVAEADFVLPLTAYLAAHTAQFRVIKTHTSDTASSTVWIDWDLTKRGNVISLTWDLIQ